MSTQTALATRDPQALARPETALVFTDEMKQATRSMVGSLIKTEAQFGLFFAFCANTGLNPVAKEVYGWTDWKDKDKLVIAVGIDGFRKLGGQRANVEAIETAYCGDDGVWRNAWPKSMGTPAGCRCRIWLQGARRPIESVIYFEDFHMKSNPNWNEQTGRVRHMMAVRAEAHAWRKVPNTGLNGYNVQLTDEVELPTLTETYPDALTAGETEPGDDGVITDTPNTAAPVPHANATPPRMDYAAPTTTGSTPAPPSDPGAIPTDIRVLTNTMQQEYYALGGTRETLLGHLQATVSPEAAKLGDTTQDERAAFLIALRSHRCLPGTAGWALEATVEGDPFEDEA